MLNNKNLKLISVIKKYINNYPELFYRILIIWMKKIKKF